MNTQFMTFPNGDSQQTQALKQDGPLLDAYLNTVVNVAKKVSPSVYRLKSAINQPNQRPNEKHPPNAISPIEGILTVAPGHDLLFPAMAILLRG